MADKERGAESMKVIADSIGISNVSPDALKYLADDVIFRLKSLVQDAMKFCCHGKRKRLSTDDYDRALKVRNMEPLYGFTSREFVPFRFTSGGGREVYFIEDEEMNLDDLLHAEMPKVPQDVSVRAHWMVVEGVQPAVPENPAPSRRDLHTSDAAQGSGKRQKQRGKPLLKPVPNYELSVEQQMFYKELTEACVCERDRERRLQAEKSLQNDPGLQQLLPHLCTFISEGIKVNVVQHSLAFLVYLNRMIRALAENPNICLEKYLHELLPALLTCILNRQLSVATNENDHTLRDYAARTLALLTEPTAPTLRPRIVRVFVGALESDRSAMTTLYGALAALSELGPDTVNAVVLPLVKPLYNRFERVIELGSSSPVERVAADQFKTKLIRAVAAALAQLRRPPDRLDEYVTEFDSVGAAIFHEIEKIRRENAAKQQRPPLPVPPTARNSTVLLAKPQSNVVPSTPLHRLGPPQLSIPASPSPQTVVIVNRQAPATPTTPLPGKVKLVTPTTATPTRAVLQQQQPPRPKIMVVQMTTSGSTPTTPTSSTAAPHLRSIITSQSTILGTPNPTLTNPKPPS